MLFLSFVAATVRSIISILFLIATAAYAHAKHGVCDQTPPMASVLEPSEGKNVYKLTIVTKESGSHYLPDQTYVLKLKTLDDTRPFRWFMITVEDPDIDKYNDDDLELDPIEADVGTLKTLDNESDKKSIHSDRCRNSVENADNSDKYEIEIHWISPKQSDKQQKVRLKAMVAENEETWFVGENLTIVLEKNSNKAADTPPFPPSQNCSLCSEARYEIFFKGIWSRATHPRHYPTKPDENGYSFLIGASHAFSFTLWQQGKRATMGMKKLAEEANVTYIEREIIKMMSPTDGTRTLIRGKRRHHPEMSEPSHSLFRVDRIHHLFSIAVAMRPSPDWFLGTSKFELCTEKGWLKKYSLPLYPWDAGTMDGISYESAKTMTQPIGNIERVAVGSFDRESPFYQMNLNDLRPFAILELNRLDVFPLVGVDCSSDGVEEAQQPEAEVDVENSEDSQVEPKTLEWRRGAHCRLSDWGDWSPCKPDHGYCGIGTQIRVRELVEDNWSTIQNNNIEKETTSDASCLRNEDTIQSQDCFVQCDD